MRFSLFKKKKCKREEIKKWRKYKTSKNLFPGKIQVKREKKKKLNLSNIICVGSYARSFSFFLLATAGKVKSLSAKRYDWSKPGRCLLRKLDGLDQGCGIFFVSFRVEQNASGKFSSCCHPQLYYYLVYSKSEKLETGSEILLFFERTSFMFSRSG